MKKSEIYYALQIIVLHDEKELLDNGKLQILRELMIQEDLAKYEEEQEAKKHEGVQ